MRVYHFVNRQFGLEDIKRRRLKVATISDLNDPFEIHALDLRDEKMRSGFREFKRELAESIGLICFSKDWQNPVQWIHYAEKHQGLCLVFDVPPETVQEVSYTRVRLVDATKELVSSGTLSEKTVLRLLSTKFHHWRYEQEVRAFLKLEDKDHESGLYFTDFSEKLKLTGVIVGATSTISRSELAEALGDLVPSVEVSKARLAFGSFRVVKQQNRALWPDQ